MAAQAGSPKLQDPWTIKVLGACKTGDTAMLERLLHEQDEEMFPEHGISVLDMFFNALQYNQPVVVKLLIEEFPDFPGSEKSYKDSLRHIHHGFRLCLGAQLPMYKVLVDKWPEMKNYHYGESGDHLGAAAYSGDLEFVEYLIANGEDASRAHKLHMPILPFIRTPRMDWWTEVKIALGIGPVANALARDRKIFWLLRMHGALDQHEFPSS